MKFLIVLLTYLICSAQSHIISVKGKFTCNRPMNPEAQLFLMERDFSGSWIGSIDEDDVMARESILLNKEFRITGEAEELGLIEVYLFIFYNCGHGYQEKIFELGSYSADQKLGIIEDLS